MSGWIFPAILCFFIWGFWGLFPKLASQTIDPWSIFIYSTIGNVAVAVALLAWIGIKPGADPRGVTYAVLGGLAGSLGAICYNIAASKGRISVVVTLTGLYPLMTIFLSYFFLQEPIGIKDMVAMGLAVSAITLISL